MKMRPKDPEIERKGCPEPSKLPQRYIKRSQGSRKGVKRVPLTTPMTFQDTPWEPTGHPLDASGSPRLAYRPSFKANFIRERVQERQKRIKLKCAKTLKNHGFSMFFEGFSGYRGLFFDVSLSNSVKIQFQERN